MNDAAKETKLVYLRTLAKLAAQASTLTKQLVDGPDDDISDEMYSQLGHFFGWGLQALDQLCPDLHRVHIRKMYDMPSTMLPAGITEDDPPRTNYEAAIAQLRQHLERVEQRVREGVSDVHLVATVLNVNVARMFMCSEANRIDPTIAEQPAAAEPAKNTTEGALPPFPFFGRVGEA